MNVLASIPSPAVNSWSIGPFVLRAYALAIICGITAAWWILSRRYRAKGGPDVIIGDLLFSMVIFGIIGGRLYHVLTEYQLYFVGDKNPLQIFAVWKGGLGIWGAIALGGFGAWLVAKRYGLRLMPIGDAIAPALLVAQAIGRIGNYFNQELYGKPTSLPWSLEIDAQHIVGGYPEATTFHPTFLYEMLWCLAGAVILVLLERRFKLVGGQLFACYVMFYTAGRLWIESLRIDEVNMVLGLRLNIWTSVLVFIGGLIAFFLLRRRFKNNPAVNDIWVSEKARQKFVERFGSEENDRRKGSEKKAEARKDEDESNREAQVENEERPAGSGIDHDVKTESSGRAQDDVKNKTESSGRAQDDVRNGAAKRTKDHVKNDTGEHADIVEGNEDNRENADSAEGTGVLERGSRDGDSDKRVVGNDEASSTA